MSENFSVESKLAVTIYIAVEYSRQYIFLKEIFESKQGFKSASKSKNNFQPTKFSTARLKRALKSRENLPE